MAKVIVFGVLLFVQLAVVLSQIEGDSCSPNNTPCVSSCEGLPNGDYQSCHGCDVYVTCVHGAATDDRPCPAGLVWDDIENRCEWESQTCSQCQGPKCNMTKSWYADPGTNFALPGFCPSTAPVYKADFNGDGRMDLMCHGSSNRTIYYGNDIGYSNIGWSQPTGWCFHTGSSVYVGDFDGDSRSDVLCHDTAGNVWISFSNNVGALDHARSWMDISMGFCTDANTQLFIGDFDGDGKSDMLCHNYQNGEKTIAYATVNGDFSNGRTWYMNMHWCNQTDSKLYVGDFNGNGMDDMLCHDSSGNMFVAEARSGGTFIGSDRSDNMGWCRSDGCTLSVATASRDAIDDLVCHCKEPNPEPIVIRFPYGSYSFENFRQWRRNRDWCTGASDELIVGPLEPGRCGVLVCIDRDAKTASIANAG